MVDLLNNQQNLTSTENLTELNIAINTNRLISNIVGHNGEI